MKTGQRVLKGPIKVILNILGTFCVALGILGIFLPVMPTVPFLLLAATCHARSSKKSYHWLVSNRWWGKYIRNYREGRGIPLKQKAVAILLLWLALGSSAVLIISQWWVRWILFGIAIGVTVYLVRTKTYKPKANSSSPPGNEDY